MSMTIFTIDPGSAGTGIAIWKLDDWNKQLKSKKVFIEPMFTFVILPNHNILKSIEKLICVYNPFYAYLENSMYYADTTKGQAAARSGALVKLSQFTGALTQLLNHYAVNSELINPNKWKGTMSKHAVIHRIKKRNPNILASSHAWDAVGIGLYMLGVF